MDKRLILFFSHKVSNVLINDLTERHAKGFWKDRENRRQFLIDLAQSKGLDPFHPNTWTCITQKEIIAAKVCTMLRGDSHNIHISMNDYKGEGLLNVMSYRQAVADAFPHFARDK
jgi:hypothetical protein